MKLKWDVWLRGLAAAFISAAASGITAGMTAMGVDPEHFNLSLGLGAVFQMAGIVAIVGGIVGAANYLKQSPVPEWDGTDRRNGGAIPAILLCIALGFGVIACGGYKRVAHPGELDAFDGSTYDVLLSFQSGLDQANREIASGALPASHKGFVNLAGTGYNVLRDTWLGYRAVKALPDCAAAQISAGAIAGCKTGVALQDAIAKVNAALPAAHNFIAQLRALVRGGYPPSPDSEARTRLFVCQSTDPVRCFPVRNELLKFAPL